MLNKSFSLYVSKLIKPYNKTIQVDSDKSISIRSFLIGAISHNISEIKNVCLSDFSIREKPRQKNSGLNKNK